MFGKMLEKRSISVDGFDCTSWMQNTNYGVNELNENSYFVALNILSNSVAKLPILVKQTTDKGEVEAKDYYLWDLLRLKPNPSMNSFECMKSLIMLYKHYGMAGLFIDRDNKGNVAGLYPARINQFTIDNIGLIKSSKMNKVLIDFTCCDTQGNCFDSDMIILRDNSLDGIRGKPTKHYIKNTLDTSLKAQDYQNDLFSNGLTNKAVVQMTSDIKEEKDIKKVQEKFNRLYSSKGRIFTMPAGFNVTPLNLSLVDSQFAELKKMSKQDVSVSIGTPFSLLENGSLTEQENISYLDNTISPILTQFEQEADYKLVGLDRKKGYKIRFNVSAMLRTSPLIQKNIIIDYVKNGIYSLEYAQKLLGVDIDFEKETIIFPSGQILLKDLINGEATWQKNSTTVVKGGDNSGEEGV